VNAGYGIQIVHVGARPVLRCNIAVAVVDVQVRRAGPSDVTTIERIVHEAFGKYVARNGRQPAPMGADNHAAVALSRVWVIEADGEIAGSWSTRCTTTIYCSTPSQSPPARRGTVIVRCCSPVPRTTPRELGLSEVRLLTNQAMTENQTFYPRHGYIETARGRQGGYDCVFLRQKGCGVSTAAAGQFSLAVDTPVESVGKYPSGTSQLASTLVPCPQTARAWAGSGGGAGYSQIRCFTTVSAIFR
jgi:hypothetical protein